MKKHKESIAALLTALGDRYSVEQRGNFFWLKYKETGISQWIAEQDLLHILEAIWGIKRVDQNRTVEKIAGRRREEG